MMFYNKDFNKKYRLLLIADNSEKAKDCKQKIKCDVELNEVQEISDYDMFAGDVIVIVLGGDGFMLRTIHRYIGTKLLFYGINCGTVGFLMNALEEDELTNRLSNAILCKVSNISGKLVFDNDFTIDVNAINEIAFFRQENQAIHVRISVNGKVRMPKLVGDGVIFSSPAGSGAYNFSAGGMILPLSSNVVSLTPISPFRPRRWRGAILPDDVEIEFEILDSHKRQASLSADYHVYHDVKYLKAKLVHSLDIGLLFDKSHDLEERIIREQFVDIDRAEPL